MHEFSFQLEEGISRLVAPETVLSQNAHHRAEIQLQFRFGLIAPFDDLPVEDVEVINGIFAPLVEGPVFLANPDRILHSAASFGIGKTNPAVDVPSRRVHGKTVNLAILHHHRRSPVILFGRLRTDVTVTVKALIAGVNDRQQRQIQRKNVAYSRKSSVGM